MWMSLLWVTWPPMPQCGVADSVLGAALVGALVAGVGAAVAGVGAVAPRKL